MTASSAIQCDLLVIGTGMAGMAAALFAANRGADAAHVGMTGQINFASGFLDLMGVYPVAEKRRREDPWAAVADAVRDLPGHPYARVTRTEIEAAFGEFTAFLEQAGLHYEGAPDRNTTAFTAVGTTKPTFRVPASMWAGARALAEKPPCLIFDFHGLKGFSARQIRETLSPGWPDLRSRRIAFPDARGGIYPEQMARTLETQEVREKLIETVAAHMRKERAVGFPAIMGINKTREIISHMEDRLGAGVFEIPTMPPAISGLRLRKAFEKNLPHLRVRSFYQKRVLAARTTADGFSCDIGRHEKEMVLEAKAVILASGRFFGKGLAADRKQIRETIFDLPVRQPESRSLWHQKDFLDPRGHAVNQAGLETDAEFRPLDAGGAPAHPRLYAVGSILAHQDWMRMKCGSGLALATAYKAVNALLKTA